MSIALSASPNSDVAIVLVAAGKGVRTGPGLPKQYRLLGGRPLFALTIEAVAKALPGAPIVPVIHASAQALYADMLATLDSHTQSTLANPAFGGVTRQASVCAGLEALAKFDKEIKIVLIHDIARPFVSETLIELAISTARQHGAAIPATPVTDTIKQIDATGRVIATPPRAMLRSVQTPQTFDFDLILDAHRRAAAAGLSDFTDDAAVAEWAGHAIHVFDGDLDNSKVTTMADFDRAEARLLGERPDIRTGQGFDVHAFAPGDHVWLGGVQIAHDNGLTGHSDADVLIHAICDALYGALAEADIGAHFPPSDPRWKGAASEVFLRHAAERVRARDGLIAHIDATIVCEHPKIGPHRDAMRARLASILGLAVDRIAVKATTSERLGFTGRGEGIAALATATIRLPVTRAD